MNVFEGRNRKEELGTFWQIGNNVIYEVTKSLASVMYLKGLCDNVSLLVNLTAAVFI